MRIAVSSFRLGALGVAGVLAAGLSGPAAASGEQATPWQDLPHSHVRLMAASGLAFEDNVRLAVGVEIVLDAGWKTYWRTPGEGVSPSLSWDKSENVKKAD